MVLIEKNDLKAKEFISAFSYKLEVDNHTGRLKLIETISWIRDSVSLDAAIEILCCIPSCLKSYFYENWRPFDDISDLNYLKITEPLNANIYPETIRVSSVVLLEILSRQLPAEKMKSIYLSIPEELRCSVNL